MAKSKSRKSAKSKAPEKTKNVLVQVRISKEEHELLAALCQIRGQTIASRTREIIQKEIEDRYPVVVVSFNGKSFPTRVIAEKYSVPNKSVWQVIITKNNANGILPKALDFSASVTMPHCPSKIFGISFGYQDMTDNWHLQLVENFGTQGP